MTEEELVKRYGQFRAYIRKRWPYLSAEIAEDAASWATIKWLEGVALNQDFRWLFIDYLRASEMGRNHVKKYKLCRLDENEMSRIFKYEESFVEQLDKEREADLLYDLIDLALKSSGIAKTMVSMYYLDEIPMKKIGTHFNFSESRVSQIIRKARDTMRDYALQYDRFATLLEEGKLKP